MQETRSGAIVLADISGYTSFVKNAELVHSHEILTELLETVSEALGKSLRVVKLQGDMVMSVGAQPDAATLNALEDVFATFHRQVRDMTEGNTCDCTACLTVGTLTLKFIVHEGEYMWMKVFDKEDLVGADVNLACRLLKNGVPSHEYILVTESVLARVPADVRERYTPIAEEYDVGPIGAGYVDLADLRELARRPERERVTDAEAKVHVRRRVAAPRDLVWRVYADPRMKARLMHASKVDFKRGARGSKVGAVYHCYHGKKGEAPTIIRIAHAVEPHEVTAHWGDARLSGWATYRFSELGENETEVEALYDYEVPTGLPGLAMKMIAPRVLAGQLTSELDRLDRLVAEQQRLEVATASPA